MINPKEVEQRESTEDSDEGSVFRGLFWGFVLSGVIWLILGAMAYSLWEVFAR